FSKASRFNTSDNFRFSLIISTILRPDILANTFLLESAAEIAALPGKVIPKDSTIPAIVDAVPITAQCPILRHIPASAIFSSSSEISPFLESSANRQTSLVPISFPLNLPVNMAPPETTILGRSTLQAPITKDGVVLSQPTNNTTPSMG